MRLSASAWMAGAATTVIGAATLVVLVPGGSSSVMSPRAPAVPAHVRSVSFPVPGGGSRGAAAGVVLRLPKAEPFSLLGVTWDDPGTALRAAVELRTRDARTGRWSGWRDLDADAELGPDPGPEADAPSRRGGTDPLWVGPSRGVEVRAVPKPGSPPRLPDGLRLELVDPGSAPGELRTLGRLRRASQQVTGELAPSEAASTGQTATEPTPIETTAAEPTPNETTPTRTPAEATPIETTPNETTPIETTTSGADPTSSPTGTTSAGATSSSTAGPGTSSPSGTPTSTSSQPAPETAVPAPALVTRAQWGADESIVREPPSYGTSVETVFVHHTAGSNSYSCGDSAAIIRAIQAYHVTGNGWNDIGYNFLVDRCGTLFEGRAGGVDRPVIGAHTYGFNTNSTGVAVLGTYTTAGVTSTVLDVLAHLSAWKHAMSGNDPAGQVTMTAGTVGKFTTGEAVLMNRISGHRDGVATECPGSSLYAQLPTVRARASGVSGLKLTGVGGSASSGSTYYSSGLVTPSWSVSTPTSLLSRFEILVDGNVVATVPGGARSASVRVSAGSHGLQVRGVHALGASASTAPVAVVSDPVAPTFSSAPRLELRAGAVSSASAPVWLRWRASDTTALRSVDLVAPVAATFAPTITSYAGTARVGASTTWTLRAGDWAGNTATASVARTPLLGSETSATRTGIWSTLSSSSYLGGSALTSTAKGASLRWTFTGRSAAVVASRTPTSGQLAVWVDGIQVGTVDLLSSTTQHRRAVWTRTWSTAGTHTVRIVVVGTAGRPRVTADGLLRMG